MERDGGRDKNRARDFLSLLFVMVCSAVLSSAACTSTNVALGRPAIQSTTYETRGAQKAVDGVLGDHSVSITNPGDPSPWWKVHLDPGLCVTHLVITNRRSFGKLTH